MFVPLFFLGKPTIFATTKGHQIAQLFFAVSALLLVLIMFDVSQCLKVVNGNSSQKASNKGDMGELPGRQFEKLLPCL